MIKKIILYAFCHFLATLASLLFALGDLSDRDIDPVTFIGGVLFTILGFPAIHIKEMLHSAFGILPFDNLIEWVLIISNSLLWGTVIAQLIKRYKKST